MAKNLIFILVGVSLVLIGGAFLSRVGPEGPQGPIGQVGQSGKDGTSVLGGTTNYDSLYLNERLDVVGTSTVGTTSVRAFQAPGYRSLGGMEVADISIPVNNGTSSSICSIANPFWGATSSILFTGSRIFSTSSLPFNYVVSTSTAAFHYGSSTRGLIYDHLVKGVSSGITDLMEWTPHLNVSTTTNRDLEARGNLYFDNNIAGDGSFPFNIGATEYLNWNIATGTPGPLGYWSGTCSASFTR